MNALSLVVSLWLAAQSSPAEGGDPFAQPQPARRTEPAIRLGNPQPQSSGTQQNEGGAAKAPVRNPLRSPPAAQPPAKADDEAIAPVQQTIAVVGEAASSAEGDESVPRVTAKDYIAGLLVAPEGEGLTGQPLRLVDALSRSAGRPPADIVRAYWELASATALYHQRRREAAQLETLAGGGREPAPELTLAQGTARAALVESKVTALAAQQRLRSLVPAAGGSLPTVADVPHTGAYHTYFQEIFGRRPAPAELTLLEQTLPLEKEAVQARFKAAQAAADHGEQAWTRQQAGQATLADVLAAVAEGGRQERAFVQSVIRYNLDIAGYALRVAPAGVPPRTIVGMLIKDPLQRTAMAEFDGQVIPAGASELIEVSEPARLIPPDQSEGHSGTQPAAVPPSETDALGRPVVRSTFEPRTKPAPADPRTSQRGTEGDSPFVTRKPELPTSGLSADATLFPDLSDAPAGRQAHLLWMGRLTNAPPSTQARSLDWNQTRQAAQGPAHYWQTYAAEVRAKIWDDAAAQLADLGRRTPADQALEVRAARLAAQAEAADARLQFHAARFAWGLTLGAPQRQASQLPWPTGTPDLAWLTPAEAPSPANPSPNQALWRTAIQQRAVALVAADGARVREVKALTARPGDAGPAVQAIRQQTDAYLSFANTLASGQLAVGAGATAPTIRSQPTPASTKSPVSR